MMYGSLLGNVRVACAMLTKEVERSFGSRATEYQDRESVVAENVLAMLREPNDYLFMDLTKWHWQAGRLLQFRYLFLNHISEDCLRTIDNQLSAIVRGFRKLDEAGVSGKLNETLSTALGVLRSQYLADVQSMHHDSEGFAEMDMDSLERAYDDMEDLLYEPRHAAELVSLASVVIKPPPSNAEWIKEIKARDQLLVTISRRYHRRIRELKGSYEDRENTEKLGRDRFAFPPELYPWMWVDLEEQEARPLSVIFDFDPEDVKSRFAGIKLMP